MAERSFIYRAGDAIDRALSVVAPKSSAKRIMARAGIELHASGGAFRGGRKTRLNHNWPLTTQQSADDAYDGEIDGMRDAVRDLNRNDGLAAGATDTIVVNVVKNGFIPQCRLDPETVPINEAKIKNFQKAAETAYKKWVKYADIERRLDFAGIQQLAMRQILESGEFLAVRRAKERKNVPYLLALQIVEPDRLECPNRAAVDGSCRFGVYHGEDGEPTHYSIRKTHPGDIVQPRYSKAEYQKVPAYDPDGRPLVFHLYPLLRPGQTRGYPFFAPVIKYFQQINDIFDAKLVGHRVAACFAAFITNNSNPYGAAGGSSSETDGDGKRLEDLYPGMIEYLGMGQDVKFADPKGEDASFDQFVERSIRFVGTALGLPYELILKDFSKTTYSSARAALLQAYRFFQVRQEFLIKGLCQPMWELLMEEAWLRGELVAPSFRKYQWEYTRASWIAPGWEWVDPKKETDANKVALESNMTTLAKIAASRGEDWEENLEQSAREQQKMKDLKLITEAPKELENGTANDNSGTV